jgi:hypothetical protein
VEHNRREVVAAMLIVLASMAGIVLVSNIVRVNHDQLVRLQTIQEVCR